MYSKAVAYVLGILSFAPPFNGLLRFYLNRHASGVIFTLTSGCCWIGNILDIVQIPQLVKQANMKRKQREMLLYGGTSEEAHQIERRALEYRKQEESIEKHILRSAKDNRGYTTPSEVALASEASIEEARKALDYLVSKGFAEMKVDRSGNIVYHFPDILNADQTDQYEDF